VDRLAGCGLVTRQDHPDDRRGVLVQLTQVGKDAVDAAMAELLTAERGILAALDVTEHDQLTRSLRLLLARYGASRQASS
jgi:DNA-binding MarR family transcriptional regulator